MNKINEILKKGSDDNYGYVFLHSHPDDEAFLNAGLIQHLIKKGVPIQIIYTSAGLVDGVELTSTRQIEACRACEELGLLAAPTFLGYCDNLYASIGTTFSMVPPEDAASDIIALAKSFFPESVEGLVFVGYDRNGGYGHVDHRALFKVCQEIRSLGYYYVIESTMNRNIFFDWIKRTKEKLSPGNMPLEYYWGLDPWLTADEITHFYVLTDEEIAAKRRALERHITQIHTDEFPAALGSSDYKAVFGIEYFNITEKGAGTIKSTKIRNRFE